MNVLITGGAGFIGINTADYYLRNGASVTIFDNFSRKGSRTNVDWLKFRGGKLTVIEGDVRKSKELDQPVGRSDVVIHLAAQVAVTSSVQNPVEDLEINTLGTVNVLESVRQAKHSPIVLFASTNKVYGDMTNIPVVEKPSRYDYQGLSGVTESQPLDFHSPYGCSKGAADQYVRDYNRIYGLKTIVFRQSCVYGPHQFGLEDQGWVAWFMIALVTGKKITVYGDGKQVRDILFVTDLVAAYNLAIKNIRKTQGQIYNVGGGRANTISVWQEFAPLLEELMHQKITIHFSEWRPGDQKVYISDITKIHHQLGWTPKVSAKKGINQLFRWIQANKSLFR